MSVSHQLGAELDAHLAQDSYRNRRAVLVVVGGRTVLERYDGGGTYNVQSVGKSILSTLVGIAVGAGQLRLDSTLGGMLPAHRSAMRPAVAAITLRQLLTMTGGLPENFYRTVFRPSTMDWVRTILDAGQDGPTGVFQYSNGSAHLVAAALRHAVGRPVLDHARDTLFAPLGIDTAAAPDMVARPDQLDIYDAAGFIWPADPQGVHLGSGGQKLTATDLAKLGRLWLDRGRWNGRRLVPADWLAAATSPQVTPPQGGGYEYGYGFWTMTAAGHRAYAALGYGGQVVEVVPDLDLVAVVQSTSPSDPTVDADAGTAPPERYVEMIRDIVVPALH